MKTDKDRPDTGGDLPAGLAAPARRALEAAGIVTLAQVASYTENQLLRLHGMGPKAMGQLREAMAARGMRFVE